MFRLDGGFTLSELDISKEHCTTKKKIRFAYLGILAIRQAGFGLMINSGRISLSLRFAWVEIEVCNVCKQGSFLTTNPRPDSEIGHLQIPTVRACLSPSERCFRPWSVILSPYRNRARRGAAPALRYLMPSSPTLQYSRCSLTK